jgi:hypothetical protein
MHTASPDITRTREAFLDALFGYAEPDVVLAAGRAYGAAKEATESTDERCFRLGLMAADKDAEAERHMAAAADAAGLAAGRRLRWGEDAVTRSYDREELACTKLAADAMAEAERLRSQASSLRRAQEVVGVINSGTRAA